MKNPSAVQVRLCSSMIPAPPVNSIPSLRSEKKVPATRGRYMYVCTRHVVIYIIVIVSNSLSTILLLLLRYLLCLIYVSRFKQLMLPVLNYETLAWSAS